MEVFLVWVILAGLIAWWASEWGRSALGYGVLSLLLSPIISAIVLLIRGNLVEQRAEQQRREQDQKWEHERQLAALQAVAKAPAAAQAPAPSVVDALERLAQLKERGALSAEEFEIEKQRLLKR